MPAALDHINKKLSSTLQFINVAINPSNSCEVMGGTQDNGTWSNNNGCNRTRSTQVIYGDGGNAGYDATNPTWRFNEFTAGSVTRTSGTAIPSSWVITSAPLVNSGEAVAFYWPQIGDPNPVAGHAPDLLGRAARLAHAGPSAPALPAHVPQDTTPTSPTTRRTVRSS